MQWIEIDSEMNRLALAEAAQQYPEFVGHAVRVIARPLSRGFAWQLEWKGAPPPGQQAWEFLASASSGKEGIEAFRNLRPDVTLMDLRLPDLTGIDAIIAIRAEFPDARIIILTTFERDC